MGRFFDFLREQIHRSAATNFETVSKVSDAVTRNDIYGIGSAVTGEISSAVKDIVKESSSIKQELKAEFSRKEFDPVVVEEKEEQYAVSSVSDLIANATQRSEATIGAGGKEKIFDMVIDF